MTVAQIVVAGIWTFFCNQVYRKAFPPRDLLLIHGESATTYGILGVKVWIYKGEVLAESAPKREERQPRKPRPERKAKGGNK